MNKGLEWLYKIRGRELHIGNTWDTLDYFLVEPFIAHEQNEEHYICIRSTISGDEILFCTEGGVDVGNVESKVYFCLFLYLICWILAQFFFAIFWKFR